jgi:hypothetical protein
MFGMVFTIYKEEKDAKQYFVDYLKDFTNFD